MLHIILGILKWIGILLLVILLLILAVLLAVLLAPVRYHGRAVKTEEELFARLRITWLLHLVACYLTYDGCTETQTMEIRLFGIPLDSLLAFFKKMKQKGKAVRQRKANQHRKPRHSQTAKRDDTSGTQQEPPASETLPDRPDSESPEGLESTDSSDSRLTGEPLNTEAGEPTGLPDSEESAQKHPRISIIRRLQSLWQRLKSAAKTVKEFFYRIIHALRHLGSTLQKLFKSIAALPDKIQEFSDFAEEYALRTLFGDVWGEILELLRRYGPRTVTGFLRFGTDDPAQTGELTGLLYLLMPERADLTIEPNFENPMFETDVTVSGHIRAIHLIRMGWHLFRNKDLKRLIAKVKKKGA